MDMNQDNFRPNEKSPCLNITDALWKLPIERQQPNDNSTRIDKKHGLYFGIIRHFYLFDGNGRNNRLHG